MIEVWGGGRGRGKEGGKEEREEGKRGRKGRGGGEEGGGMWEYNMES